MPGRKNIFDSPLGSESLKSEVNQQPINKQGPSVRREGASHPRPGPPA